MTLALASPANDVLPYQVREIRDTDHGFIFGTWIRGYLDSRWSRHVESEDYFKGQLRVIESIVARGVVLLAEHTQYPELFLGFGAAEVHEERPVLHYLYVKKDYRRHGVARALEAALLKRVRVGSEPVRRTHRGPLWVEGYWDRTRAERVEGWADQRGYLWNPYCLYPPKEKSR